jgi:hypothetical protein
MLAFVSWGLFKTLAICYDWRRKSRIRAPDDASARRRLVVGGIYVALFVLGVLGVVGSF